MVRFDQTWCNHWLQYILSEISIWFDFNFATDFVTAFDSWRCWPNCCSGYIGQMHDSAEDIAFNDLSIRIDSLLKSALWTTAELWKGSRLRQTLSSQRRSPPHRAVWMLSLFWLRSGLSGCLLFWISLLRLHIMSTFWHIVSVTAIFGGNSIVRILW